jgi:dinuclear metal center YbgI/SA1388 family protein
VPKLVALIAHLDALLEPQRYSDYGPNGLQVPGSDEVGTVVTAVSASVELFERAAQENAQLVLVHHGLFWQGGPQHIDHTLYRRLRPLFAHDIALAAYHLPLDGHPEVGNNALIAQGLGCERVEPFGDHKGMSIGVAGHFGDGGVPAAELAARVEELTGREPLHLAFGPERVRSLGIVSGGGASYVGDAIGAGLDAFLTGEPAERVMTLSREAGIHFIAAGHYATETFGVRRLGEILAEGFGVRHVFVDDPNPI